MNLDYALPIRRSALRRRALRLSLILALAGVVGVIIDQIRVRGPIWLAERKCLGHAAQAGIAVCITGRDADAEKDGTTDFVTMWTKGAGTSPIYARGPNLSAWAYLQTRLGLPAHPLRGGVFLGPMTCPNGERRLVALGLVQGLNGPMMTATVISPGGLTGRPAVLGKADSLVSFDDRAMGALSMTQFITGSRMFAAVPDPADRTHLSIRLDCKQQSGHLDVYITDENVINVSLKADSPRARLGD